MKYFVIVLLIFGFEAAQQTDWEKWFRAEKHQETLRKQMSFAQSEARFLVVSNIFGGIKITGTKSETVDFEVLKTIEANGKAELEKGKERITIRFEQVGDTIFAYPDADFLCNRSRPCDCQKLDHKVDFSYQFDFEIKVPMKTDLHLSTINEGNIVVKNVAGKLDLSNINGSIEMTEVSNTTKAHTINGKITAQYTQNPPSESSFKALNEDITIRFKPELSAKCHFKSMNGDLFTDFDVAEHLSGEIRQSEKQNGKAVYKIEKRNGIRIGKGETEYAFETLNGNVYLKKQ